MTSPVYLDSTAGNDSNSGLTSWANAKATLAAAMTVASTAGDIIYVSPTHFETSATNKTFSFAGTVANLSKVICASTSASPPTAVATGAVMEFTSSALCNLGGSFYMYGVSFNTSLSVIMGYTAQNVQLFENCALRQNNAGSAGVNYVDLPNSINKVSLKGLTLKFAAAGNVMRLGKSWDIQGVTVESGTATSTTGTFRFPQDRSSCNGLIEGGDFSQFTSSWIPFSNDGLFSGVVTMRDSKIPAISALLNGAITAPGQRFRMINCAATGINYALWIEDYSGSIRHETVIVKTGGASDGVTPISWKMVTTANAKYPATALVTEDIILWNETVGSPITLTVDIVHDSVTALNDDEVWMEVRELGTSGGPVSSFLSDAKASFLATAAAQDSSSATWTTTGMTNPNKQKLVVASFTPALKGFIIVRVFLGKASKTLYVDPEVVVS